MVWAESKQVGEILLHTRCVIWAELADPVVSLVESISSPSALTVSRTDRNAALLAAYNDLMAETGRRPGVRTLRERARTSTDAAAIWLKEHSPERRPPEIPAESLAPVLAPLWAAAADAASQALQDEHHAARPPMSSPSGGRSRTREQAHEAGQAAAEIRERAQRAIHEADQAAAVAQAEAAALREALAAIRPTTDHTQEKS